MAELVSTGGKLPYILELQTGKVLDVFMALTQKTGKDVRKKAGSWLYARTRPGGYYEVNPHFHLAYVDQRDGHGSQHYWRLFFDDELKSQIEIASKSSALAVSDTPTPKSDQSSRGINAPYEWGGMYFRSKVEIIIAEELDKRELIFFGNPRGRYSLEGSLMSAEYLNGRVELDFLIFKQGKCLILQIDGSQHNRQRVRDYALDRVMLRQGNRILSIT